MRKLAIIGCGGIGSNFLKYFLEVLDTFEKKELMFIHLFDEDIVEEKNLKRRNQNFEIKDLMVNKAEALAERYKDYGIAFTPLYITEENVNLLENFDDIIICSDNHKVRKLLYNYALTNTKFLIDLRAQGTIWGYNIVDGTYNMEYYNKTIFGDSTTMERKGGCQLQSDIDNDNIQNASKTVAFYIANCIYLQHIRQNKLATIEFKTVY